MDNTASISQALFELTIELENIERDITELQFKRDTLRLKKQELQRKLDKAKSKVNIKDWERNQQLTMNLLQDEVRDIMGDVIDI